MRTIDQAILRRPITIMVPYETFVEVRGEHLLAWIIYAESLSNPEDFEAIGWSVVNRLGDKQFWKTLYDVIHQPMQYQPLEAGGGPVGKGCHVKEMRLRPGTLRSISKVLVLMCLMAATSAAQAAQSMARFDLICKIRGRTVVVNEPGRDPVPGRLGPAVWSDTSRYAFDLDRKLYLGAEWVDRKPWAIPSVTKRRIYLHKSGRSFEFIDRKTLRLSGRGVGVGYVDEIVTGHCRRATFTPFVKRRLR